MKNDNKCSERGCPGVFICRGEYDDFECKHFHIALESKLQSTLSTNTTRAKICPNCKSDNTTGRAERKEQSNGNSKI